MSLTQQARMRGEARLWRAVLRSTESELMQAFARGDREAVRRLEQEARAVRAQADALAVRLKAVAIAG